MNLQVEIKDIGAILPILFVFGFSLVVLVVDLLLDEAHKHWNAILSLLGLTSALVAIWLLRDFRVFAFGGLYQMDHFTNFFNALFCLIGGATVLGSYNYLKIENINRSEFYVLLLMSIVGMMIMAGAGDYMVLFLGIETMSIPVYILAGFRKKRAESMESALKYFLVGAFAAGFLLYGMAMIYGVTGTTSIVETSKTGDTASLLLLGGIGLIIVGLGFKVSAVPFHMWTPDVYQGAPTPITGFMAVAVKAAGFSVIVRVLMTAFPDSTLMAHWREILWVLSVATMTVGNIVALAQTNIKRMLAYSSIAHAGYLLIGVVSANSESLTGIFYYLMAYTVMNLGAFGCIVLTAWRGVEGDELKDFQGVGFEKPAMGMFLSVFLLSLAGIPPTAGFVGKFYIFAGAVKAGYYLLAVIGVLNAVVAAYYYLRVLVVMYMKPLEKEIPPEDRSIFARGPFLALTLTVCMVLTLVAGIWPFWFYAIAWKASQIFYL